MANQMQKNAENATVSKKKSSHFIKSFLIDIGNIENGTYIWDEVKKNGYVKIAIIETYE